jgi:hypothetical protein
LFGFVDIQHFIAQQNQPLLYQFRQTPIISAQELNTALLPKQRELSWITSANENKPSAH